MRAVLFHIQHIALMILTCVFRTLQSLIFYEKKKHVTPVNNPLLLKSATVLAREIREGNAKSEHIIRAYIQRILEVEPLINATTDQCFENALEEARKADSLVASGKYTKERLAKDKPFLGVPLTVKLLLTVKGLRCSGGCSLLKDNIATDDSPCVALLKQAGAIVIASTNIPEFGMGFEANNKAHGRTNNPYDVRRTSGGSSGGESALIGAAGSVIGLGNDLAGSLRVPSHFTGIFAHKPTVGAVPNGGCFPSLESMGDCIYTGPMCRYAEDLASTMNVLTSENTIPMKFGLPVEFKKLKLLFLTKIPNNPMVYPVDEEILQGLQKAVSHFEKNYGVDTKEIQIPSMFYANKCFNHIVIEKLSKISDMKSAFTAGKGSHINAMLDGLKLIFGKSTFSASFLGALNFSRFPLWYRERTLPFYKSMLKNLENEFDYLLDENTVLILPTFPTSATYPYGTFPLLPSTCYTSIFNLIGFPATQCPIGFNKDGLPYGIQIVGRKNNDPLTVACAIELEKAFGGWVPPDKVQGVNL